MHALPDVNALPVEERLRLMESLWDSLCVSQPDGAALPAWHGKVLAQRMARIDNGSEPISPWSQAKERIRAQVLGS